MTPEQLAKIKQDFPCRSRRHHAKLIWQLAHDLAHTQMQVLLLKAQVDGIQTAEARKPKAHLDPCEIAT